VLTINRYYGYIDSAIKKGRYDVMWNILGKISVLLGDFNAITISEIAGLDNDIALAPLNNSSLNVTQLIRTDEPKTDLTQWYENTY
jgi:hypothetical protein